MEEASKKKILVVEDEKAIVRSLTLKLAFSGFEVAVAYDGEEALNLLEKEKFDLILLDLMMPKVDGFTVLQKMREKGDKTPVIVASNLSQEEDIARAKAYGASYYTKSTTPLSQIVEHIKEALAAQ